MYNLCTSICNVAYNLRALLLFYRCVLCVYATYSLAIINVYNDNHAFHLFTRARHDLLSLKILPPLYYNHTKGGMKRQNFANLKFFPFPVVTTPPLPINRSVIDHSFYRYMCKLQTSKCFQRLSTRFHTDSESLPTPSINMTVCLIGPRFPMQN